jgi:hypothetical protein
LYGGKYDKIGAQQGVYPLDLFAAKIKEILHSIMHASLWNIIPTQPSLATEIDPWALLHPLLEKITYTPPPLSVLLDIMFCSKPRM